MVPVAAASGGPSRIANLSILTSIGAGGDSFTLGYVVGGDGTVGDKPLVIRAAGPSLGAMDVSGTLADPRLELFTGSLKTSDNDNWGGGADLAAAMAAVGAFPFAGVASRDSAVLATLSRGGSSVKVSAADNGSGRVIAEIYDATPARDFTGNTPRLVNVSVLKEVGEGLTAGFVVAGVEPRTILIRAIGPTLAAAPFGLSDVVANPRLVLMGAGQKRIGENDDWGGTPALAAAFAATGAFELPATSQDAALLVTLAPGDYSVLVSRVGDGSGVGLVEIYEVGKEIATDPVLAPFTIMVLPDTQYYSKPHPAQNGAFAMFTSQTDWIQKNRATENIVYVAHVGDIVEDGDAGGSIPASVQWANAAAAMQRLESPVSIPYGLAVGNHDQEPIGDVSGTTIRYNEIFGVDRFKGRPYYGGHFGSNNNNHYDLFTAGGQDYIAVYVEYDPSNLRPEVTAWANAIVAAHPNRKAMLVTHHMAAAGNDYAAFGAQGARLYNAMKGNGNLFLALGGHVRGGYNFRRDPVGMNEREKVTTLIANYQFDPLGGAGFMRLYTFSPNHGYMTCRTYSPYFDQYRTDRGHAFTQSLDPRGPAEEGAVVLSNNTLVVAAVLSRVNGADLPEFSTVAVNFQTAAKTNQWSGWSPLTGRAGFRQVHAVALSDDRVAVFAAGQAADVWLRYQLAAGPGGAWSPWVQIPATPLQPDGSKALSYIKGVRLNDDRLAAIGWSDGGAVYYTKQAYINGPFEAWSSLGGSGFRQGDAVRLSDNRIAVFAVGHDTAVQVNLQQASDGGWSGWSTIPAGGSLYSYVSAIARPDNTLAVFATRAANPNQTVRGSVSDANGAGWTTFSNLGDGGTGLARVHAVVRPDGAIGLFGSTEHGTALHSIQASAGGPFSSWRNLGSPDRHEIGSVKGVVLNDNSMAAVSHGASTMEYYAYQARADEEWTVAAGLPVAWLR